MRYHTCMTFNTRMTIEGDVNLMAPTRLSTIQEKGQVTIPADLRKKLDLRKGDQVVFTETEEGILISSREAAAIKALEKLSLMLREKGLTLEELTESSEAVRTDLVKEMYELDPNNE